MAVNLREELQHPTTPLGKQYLSLVLFTIVVSVFQSGVATSLSPQPNLGDVV